MQNQLEMEAVSVRLYNYMCEEIVGTENIVRYRRLYYKLHDDIFNDNRFEFISSGSKAEGLDFPESDFDFMLLLKSWEVYEDKTYDKDDILILDTDNASPGFALLKKLDSSSFPFFSTLTANGNLISNKEFFNTGWSYDVNDVNIFEIHGPCTSDPVLVNYDLANCLKCHSWPTIAKRWLLRLRPSGWPSQKIISEIISQGCLLVPVGSKSSFSEGHPFEWRFSFSLSEKLLVHSFNHTQLLCYALLKIWLKEILNSDNSLNNKLCSYFMKTVLFWILEEDDNLNWEPQNLLHCFLLCINRLRYWIACGYFPNYFIPEHNMIDGKLSHDVLEYLSLTLDTMDSGKNWNIMLSVPSLRNFRNLPISVRRKPQSLSEVDKAVLPLHTFGGLILNIWNDLKEHNLSAFIIYRIIHKHLPNTARKILTLMFLKENRHILASFDIVNCSNKRVYLGYKECLARILINIFHDAVLGWLFLAAFFYSSRKYEEMSCILEFSTNIRFFKNRFVHDEVNITTFRDISKLKKMVYSRSFIKRHKYEISRVLYTEFTGNNFEKCQFLSSDISEIGTVEGQNSECLFFFLKFLYVYKHGNSLDTESALQLLKTIVVEKNEKTTNVLYLLSDYSFIIKAFELLEDEEGLQTLKLSFLKAFKKSDQMMKLAQKSEEMRMGIELL